MMEGKVVKMFSNLLSQGWLVAAIAVVIATVFIFALVQSRASYARRVAGLQRKSRLFSVSERKFFESLSDALDYDFHIFAKVGVLEIIERGPSMSRAKFKSLCKQLENERFDYVLCKKSDLSVSAVIELECFDRAVKKSHKRQRDALISEICKASKLRLFYFDTRQDYLGLDIRRLITGSSKCANKPAPEQENSTLELSELSDSQSLITEHVGDNTCPDCHSDLVTKVAVKGKHIGERFLMCRKYPYCEYRVLLNDPNVISIRSSSEKLEEIRKGYSGWSGK